MPKSSRPKSKKSAKKAAKPTRSVAAKKKASTQPKRRAAKPAKPAPRKAAPKKSTAAALLAKWDAEGVESGKLTSIPDGKARPEALKITYGGQNLGTSTQHFELYYDSSFGSAGQALCAAMAKTVEADYRILSSWFGGVQVDSFDLQCRPGQQRRQPLRLRRARHSLRLDAQQIGQLGPHARRVRDRRGLRSKL